MHIKHLGPMAVQAKRHRITLVCSGMFKSLSVLHGYELLINRDKVAVDKALRLRGVARRCCSVLSLTNGHMDVAVWRYVWEGKRAGGTRS